MVALGLALSAVLGVLRSDGKIEGSEALSKAVAIYSSLVETPRVPTENNDWMEYYKVIRNPLGCWWGPPNLSRLHFGPSDPYPYAYGRQE